MPLTGLPFKWIEIVLKGNNNIVNLFLLFALSEKNKSEVKKQTNKKNYLLDGQLNL